jgi:hypothetical protein
MSDTITLPRAIAEQALHVATAAGYPVALIAALKTALEQPAACRWLQDGDEDSGTYMASCNRRYFVLQDGTPTDNHMTHCCYCGKPLVEVPIEPEDNHE